MARPERDAPDWAKSIAELRELSDDDLVRQHDALATGRRGDGPSGPGEAVRGEYYREELMRRTLVKQGRWMVTLTGLVAILTIVNVLLVAVDVL